MSQAAFWEIIAIPDIRLQTAALAARFTERLTASREAPAHIPNA
jgi:uncharacterized NAD(P)/FAD-binding protein YdhS